MIRRCGLLVERLRRQRIDGRLSSADVRAVAAVLVVSERTVWRWLTSSDTPPERAGRTRYELTEADRDEYADWRGNVKGLWRARKAAGRPTSPLRTLQRACRALAGSSLPRLAAELPVRLPCCSTRHAVPPAWQTKISAAATFFAAENIALIDVGGDAITTGDDPGLRSPLADQLALAACVRTGIPTRLLIAGPGLDGEIPYDIVTERLAQLDAEHLPDLNAADIGPVRHIFTWHPSEASGLLAAAAAGRRGRVEVRDAGDQVELTDATTTLLGVDVKRAAAVTPAGHLTDSTALDQAEQIIRDRTGISEIEYETRKAAQIRERTAHRPDAADLPEVDRRAAEARQRGADFISVRRLSELLGATTLETFAALSALLAAHRPDAYEPSVYRTTTG